MDEWVILLVLVLILILAGAVCGIAALLRTFSIDRRLNSLEAELRRLHSEIQRMGRRAGAERGASMSVAEEPPVSPSEFPPVRQAPSPIEFGPVKVTDLKTLSELLPQQPPPLPLTPEQEESGTQQHPVAPTLPHASLEITLGTKWLVWVGVGLLLAATGFFVKYAYDNAWVGPQGRIAIGTISGIVAIGLGERFRRRDWFALFQSLTGCGIGMFYICIFAAFQIYHLTGQGVAMVLAVLVTVLAVVMAVAHNSVVIALLGLVGGFLSPVLLSTGTNHPHALFTYIAILDLIAMGTAYFRRWRALDLLSFLGTVLLYEGWYEKFYASDQMTPALIYTSLFYLMFLLIPTLYSLVRRTAETHEGLLLVASNAVWSFSSYYRILFHDYRHAMGFVVLGQAILVFLLFQLWASRAGKENRTAESLLIIALGLVTIAVPIQLKFYGVPIAWAMEGAVLVAIGVRFRQTIPKWGGVGALFLAAGGLLYRLPLHRVGFTPIFNIPFGSWGMVIAAAVAAFVLLYKDRETEEHRPLAAASFLLAFALGCALPTMELSLFWTIHPGKDYRIHEYSSLAVLWALIPSAVAAFVYRRQLPSWMPLAWVCYVIGIGIFLAGLSHYGLSDVWLILNTSFLSKLVFIVSLWWGAFASRRSHPGIAPDVLESLGHGLLAILAATEVVRWAEDYWVSSRVGMSLISAVWALQALVLIWLGLFTRTRLRRIAGFALFAVCVGKILVVDMSTLKAVYRIVSFFAGGVLLITAGYFYQRYSPMLLGEEEKKE